MKIKLPQLKYVETPQWQKDCLDTWLREWSIKEHLDSAESEDIEEHIYDDNAMNEQLPQVAEFDAEVNAGQIRLFSHDQLDEEFRPRYFSVLGSWRPDNDFLIAPFSYMSEPATTGELDTQRDHFSLKVLELWNARVATKSAVAKSWIVDVFSESELSDARTVYQHIAFGDELPADLIQRVGPPIINPNDPRLCYQQEERVLLNSFERNCAKLRDSNHQPTISFTSLLGEWNNVIDEFALAAAGHDDVIEKVYLIDELNIEIVVSEETGSDDLVVNVYDNEGEPSNVIDGAIFIDSEQTIIATIHDTTTRFLKSEVDMISSLVVENKIINLQQI